MKVFCYHLTEGQCEFLEVEVQLIPGTPKISLIGLPDSSLREGVLRIQSAFLQHGFNWPRSKHIIVNLKPSRLKKLNTGMEFSIALAVLLKTKQLSFTCFETESSSEDKNVLVLGDIDLNGNVNLSQNFYTQTLLNWSGEVITGFHSESLLFDHYKVSSLSQLKDLKENFQLASELSQWLKKPEYKDLEWTPEEVELIQILALGGHSALIGGPQGCGKTSLIQQVCALREPPSLKEFSETQDSHLNTWRPIVKPHHSIPKISLIGGGVPPRRGEVSRAHRGLLVLDEFLEFKKESLEVLREAMQENQIEVSRLGTVVKYPCDFQALATTNLCPCGRWDGQGYMINCTRNLSHCKSYMSRLIGPVVDRFEVLWLKPYRKKSQEVKMLSSQIDEHLQKVREFCQLQLNRSLLNSKCDVESIESEISESWMLGAFNFDSSLRRRFAFLRVARTLADLDQSQKIKGPHLKRAHYWTQNGFLML